MSDTGWVFDWFHLRSLACMGGASCLQYVGHLGNAACTGSIAQKINLISVICPRGILGNYLNIESSQFVMLEGCIVDDYFSTSWKFCAHGWDAIHLRNVVCIFMNDYFDTSWKCGAHGWDAVPPRNVVCIFMNDYFRTS